VVPEPSAQPSVGPLASAVSTYTIGYSNAAAVGNGFREEQICTAKAQALASGQVSKMVISNRTTDAAGQLEDIRRLIATGVDAIVFNPNSPTALDPAIQEAHAAGIVTVSVDQSVTDPYAYDLYNDQVQYGYLGAKWLFEQMGGRGNVYYMRGLAGASADSDRDKGFKRALADYPKINVLPSKDGVYTGWDPATASNLMDDWIASGRYDNTQGIWTSGVDSVIVDTIKAANKPFVPIVGADLSGFVNQLLDPINYPGLKGAAVTNTAAVGGAGVQLALMVLNKVPVSTAPSAGIGYVVLLKPVLADNTSDAGKTLLKSWQSLPGNREFWPLAVTIDGWTTYTPAQAIACVGPGE
jgi:ribose transport system substrate-binding protein